MAAGSTSYPTGLDSNSVATGSTEISSGLYNNHSVQIEAIQAKVGINSSTVATSIDYFLKHGSGAFRTHKHDGTSDDGAKLDWDDIWLDAVHTHASDAEGGTLDWDTCWADAVHNHSSNAEGGAIPEASITFSATGHDHSGTTAGNLIPAAGIETDAITSDKILADAVTAAKMIYGMIRSRQGGATGDASWITAGTSNVDTSAKNIFIQCGSQTTDNTTNGPTNGWYYSNLLTVTFPTAYNQIPLVIPALISGTGVVAIESITTSNFTIRGKNPASVAAPVIFAWISIGQ